MILLFLEKYFCTNLKLAGFWQKQVFQAILRPKSKQTASTFSQSQIQVLIGATMQKLDLI